MDDNLPTPASPPLPKKGAYNFDFDNFDEFSNPFESKSKMQMGSSPPIRSNDSNAYQFEENEDPFQSKKSLVNSPPGSPKIEKSETFGEDKVGEVAAASDSSGNLGQALEKNAGASDENKTIPQFTPKKKKIIKKPQVQSKFKPPKNVKRQNNTGDIEIIMPGMDKYNENTSPSIDNFAGESTEDICLSKPTPSEDALPLTQHNFPMDMEEDGPPPQDAAPDAMALSTEIDRKFIDEDEIDEQLNGFAGSQEEFKDARDWTSPKQVKKKIPESSNMDYNEPLEKPDTGVSPSRSGIERHPKSGDENVEIRSSHQIISEPSKEKHPAARVLETAQGGSAQYAVPKSSVNSTMDNMQSAEKKNESVVQVVQVLRYSQTDWNKMKQELELSFQTSLLNKERDWSRLLADRDKKISSLEETNKKLKSTNEDMRAVVTEFEKTIAQLQSEKDKLKSESHKTTSDLEGERNQALEDLASVESAFSDLHRRYEKSKTIIEGFKRNEEQLKECMEDLKSKLKKSESKLTSLRSQAEEKLDKANEDIEKIKKSTKSEVVRLEAALKKSELRISSLDEALTRKEKENQELTAICDELIAKVGS